MADVSPIMDQVRDAMLDLNAKLIPQGYYLFLNPNNTGTQVAGWTTEVDYLAGMLPDAPPYDGSQATLVKLSPAT